MTIIDRKLQQHIDIQLKKRDPTIQQLVRSYNNLCKGITALITSKKAPKGSVAPMEIDGKGIFQLDVDNEIWLDLDLDRTDKEKIPRWLGDEGVREGIRAMLAMNRCEEDADRLRCERKNMQEWFSKEWKAVKSALSKSSK